MNVVWQRNYLAPSHVPPFPRWSWCYSDDFGISGSKLLGIYSYCWHVLYQQRAMIMMMTTTIEYPIHSTYSTSHPPLTTRSLISDTGVQYARVWTVASTLVFRCWHINHIVNCHNGPLSYLRCDLFCQSLWRQHREQAATHDAKAHTISHVHSHTYTRTHLTNALYVLNSISKMLFGIIDSVITRKLSPVYW